MEDTDKSLLLAFKALDIDHDGQVSSHDLLRAYLGQPSNDDSTGSKSLSFPKFCQLLDAYGLQVLHGSSDASSASLESNIAGLLRDLAISDSHELKETDASGQNSLLSYRYWTESFDWTVIKHLVAGGVAGGVSRTV
ncbi:hypothetical protein L0F63_005089, partial [Massospora cicadina]